MEKSFTPTTDSSLIRYLTVIICLIWLFHGVSTAGDLPLNQASEAAPAGTEASFSFIVWGHPRGADDKDPPLHLEDFHRLVKTLGPDFILITGDMIQGRIGRIEEQKQFIESDWDYFDQCVKRLHVPIFRLPGNHDVSNKTTSDIYSKRYPQPPYSFSHKGSRFILLDSIGIKQRQQDNSPYWGHEAKPFDREQLQFIKAELTNQNKYNHLFFFMHHTSPWSETESFWWDDVHPLLVNGKTRAVFSGDNPSYMKFAHIEQDGIHYLLNNTFPARTLQSYKKWPKWSACGQRQMDNVQFVQVNGNEVQYKTHVIGEMNTESLSWRYYEKVDQYLYSWQREFVNKLQEKYFYRLKNIVLVFAVWGGVFFLFGILFTSIFLRFKK